MGGDNTPQFVTPTSTPGGPEGEGVALGVSHKNILVNTEEEPLIRHDYDDGDVNRFPPSIKYIMSNEICERFSYYGLRAILALYLTEQLLFSETNATVVVHAFTMGAYATTLIGGYLSDAVLGKYRTIFYVSLIYCSGGAVLAITAIKGLLGGHWWGMALGLFLIALGTGGIKPVVSAFVGDQFTPAQAHLLERVFRLFYFCINFGSVFSTLLTPVIRTNFGYAPAFGLPAVLLLVATSIFWVGRRKYRTYAPQGSVLKDAAKLIYYATSIRIKYGRGSLSSEKSYLFLAEGQFPTTLIQDVSAALRVLLVFVPLPFFWALFDQHATRWIFQAQAMNRDIDLSWMHLGTITVAADQIPALDPILVLILVPLFDQIIYPTIARFRPFRPLPRMTFGMLLIAGAFVVAGFLQILIDNSGENGVHIVLQVPQYILLASGEIMVSITGLEFAYTQAPRSMKSMIMSGWLLTVSIGNLLVVVVAESSPFAQWVEFFFFSGLMVVATGVFVVISFRYKHSQHDQPQ